MQVSLFKVLTLLILEFGFGVNIIEVFEIGKVKSLNPSYTGIWLRGKAKWKQELLQKEVLTLLILEFGFGGIKENPWRHKSNFVLTLLILEFGFGVSVKDYEEGKTYSVS